MKLHLLLLFVFAGLSVIAQDLNSLGGGVTLQGTVYAIEYDSVSNYLFVGGDIRSINGVVVHNVARYDGNSWTDLNGGVDGTVFSLKLKNHELYVGGYFQNAGQVGVNNIAKWDGVSWSSPGPGLPYVIRSIEFFHDSLYTSGYPPGGSLYFLSVFDGNNWLQNVKHFNNTVSGLQATDSVLFVYGHFTLADSDTAHGLISYSNNSTFIYPEIFTNGFNGLVLKDTSIYLAPASNETELAYWSGAQWHLTNLNLIGAITNLAVFQDTLYAVAHDYIQGTGDFMDIIKISDNQSYVNIARSNHSSWTQEQYEAVCSTPSKLYFGGSLTHLGDTLAISLFSYDGNVWANPGKPASDNRDAFSYPFVLTMVQDSSSGNVIVGGQFLFAGETFSANVAMWDGTQWISMDGGLSSRVTKVIYFNNDLYAFGYFGRSGSNWLGRMAKWNGTSWQSLGTGANNPIRDAIVFHNELYVCGSFDTINGMSALHVAKFDGVNWSTIGTNYLDDNAVQFTIMDDTLIVAAERSFTLFTVDCKFARLIGNVWDRKGSYTSFNQYDASFLNYHDTLFVSMTDASGGTARVMNFYNSDWHLFANPGNSYCFWSHLYDYHNQLAFSAANAGFSLFDGTQFNQVATVAPQCIVKESSVREYWGGIFSNLYQGANPIKINNVGSVYLVMPQVSVSMNTDTICERQYEVYRALTNDAFIQLHWFFPGGSPDTLSGVYEPNIQYVNPGTYSAYLVATNLVGTDTIYLNSNLVVLPCLNSVDENDLVLISVFPNPFNSEISIESSSVIERVSVVDLLGHSVRDWIKPMDQHFDLSELSSGVYLLRCESGNAIKTFKIFKQ